jgi:hypothetical protein
MIALRFQAAVSMFSIVLRKADQTRRYSISTLGASGWEVTLEREGEQRRVCYDDWHRVERALAMFKLEVSELTRSGWTEIPAVRHHAG